MSEQQDNEVTVVDSTDEDNDVIVVDFGLPEFGQVEMNKEQTFLFLKSIMEDGEWETPEGKHLRQCVAEAIRIQKIG